MQFAKKWFFSAVWENAKSALFRYKFSCLEWIQDKSLFTLLCYSRPLFLQYTHDLGKNFIFAKNNGSWKMMDFKILLLCYWAYIYWTCNHGNRNPKNNKSKLFLLSRHHMDLILKIYWKSVYTTCSKKSVVLISQADSYTKSFDHVDRINQNWPYLHFIM